MTKHIWSVLCQKSVVDSRTNNISLIDVFEQLKVNLSPIKNANIPTIENINVPVQYELVNFWSKTTTYEEILDIRIVFTDPEGKEIKRLNKKLVIPKDNKRMRDINIIQGISLKESGIYNFVISIKQKGKSSYQKVAELPLEITVVKKG